MRGDLLVSPETLDIIEAKMLEGLSYYAIARYLTDQGIPTAKGKPTWNNSTVGRICKRINEVEEPFEDPAKDRIESQVPLACSSCSVRPNRIPDLFHHVWDAHHRMPTRKERTPRAA